MSGVLVASDVFRTRLAAQNVTTTDRSVVLSWKHHRHVAALPSTQQRKWLARAYQVRDTSGAKSAKSGAKSTTRALLAQSSRRKAAKVLGVSHEQVRKDVGRVTKVDKSVNKVDTRALLKIASRWRFYTPAPPVPDRPAAQARSI